MSRTGKFVYACLLVIVCIGAAMVTIPVVSLANQPDPRPTPTSVPCQDEDYPAYQPGMIYLAKQDENGHWLVVSTDNLCVAQDEQKLGFYPVPESFAKQVAGR